MIRDHGVSNFQITIYVVEIFALVALKVTMLYHGCIIRAHNQIKIDCLYHVLLADYLLMYLILSRGGPITKANSTNASITTFLCRHTFGVKFFVLVLLSFSGLFISFEDPCPQFIESRLIR